jgi:hypothetical protein
MPRVAGKCVRNHVLNGGRRRLSCYPSNGLLAQRSGWYTIFPDERLQPPVVRPRLSSTFGHVFTEKSRTDTKV